MNLVSMKTDDSGCEPCAPNPYGWGMSLRLNDDQCEALGITKAIPAGTVLMISAKAFVSEATESVEEDGDDKGPDVRLCLQITDMAVQDAKGAAYYDKSAMNP